LQHVARRFSRQFFREDFPATFSAKIFPLIFSAQIFPPIFRKYFPTIFSAKIFRKFFSAKIFPPIFREDFPTIFSAQIFPPIFPANFFLVIRVKSIDAAMSLPAKNKYVAIAIVGWLVLALGLVLLSYPTTNKVTGRVFIGYTTRAEPKAGPTKLVPS
jgi:hypothetical protein